MQSPHQEPRRAEIFLDIALIFILTAVLIKPLFKAKYFDKWYSIESTFISDARFLAEHWPHPQWQPLWYMGTRFDYIYPPALRYGTAAISKAVGYWPVKAYHFYTALFYCVGIAGVYLLTRVGTGSRGTAWMASAATALMSPSFLFVTPLRLDAWQWMPLRLGVLVKYGEGPHMTALALIPIALAFTWRALDVGRYGDLALAAIFSAAVVSHNFYGAASLAVLYGILVWSFWLTRREKRIFAPAFAIPALAYGLTAFWLVPSYVRVTVANLKYVSQRGNWWSFGLAVVVATAFVLAANRAAKGKPERTWAVFVTGSALYFALTVLGNYYFGFVISGVPARFTPELDLIFILGAVTVLEALWLRPGRVRRAVATALAAIAFATSAGYVSHAWQMFPLSPDYQEHIEYRISEWFRKNLPDARVYSTGSVRFWFDAWRDLAQLGGGSDQGLLNGAAMDAQYAINLDRNSEASILWMQCLGVDAVYVSDERSQENYKDIRYPKKFDGVLPLLYDDGQGDMIYRVPRRYAARARVVETRRLAALRPPDGSQDVSNLRAYVDFIEHGPDVPAALIRDSSDAMRVRARLAPGQSIVVQETYDPAWHAWSGGRALVVHKDPMGFLAVDARPGDEEVRLQFVMPLENQVGRAMTLLSILLLAVLWVANRRTHGARST